MTVPTVAIEERALIARLRSGDTDSIEVLMERFTPKLYRLAHGITRNAADAEEVVQDVFASIVHKLDTFEGRAALWTWLYRVTTNAALNKRRGKRHEVEVPLESDLPAYKADGHRDGDRAFLLADWSQRPDEALLSKEARERLDRALARLPDDYRIIVVLRDVEELSNEEAARILGESISAVKSRLHRARMALREQLTRFFVEPAQAVSA